jgi:lysozyme
MTIGRVVDVSSAQHNGLPPGVGPAIDWATAKNNGVTTALVKATQGTDYLNPWFHIDVAGARGTGLDVLAYHFADFTDATAEAQWFMSNAGALAAVGDFETSTNVAWMRSFLQALGRPWDQCMGYGSASTFRSVYQQIPALPWVAAYGQGYPGWGVLWQFTDTAQIPGIPTNVDESSWHGSQIQYDTLFGVYAPPPAPKEDDMQLYTTNSGGTGFVVAADLSSKTGIVDGQDAGDLIATGQYVVVKLSDAQINAIPNAR